ncbi:MAG: PilZ domain-containing protein [Deltaproteobacteria bacterium]|nr:PilZ domain-containing protein [Deltaproteobacteria bacterium]
MPEKRTCRRVPLDVYLNKFIKGVPFMARARDISPEGIFLTRLLEPQADDGRVGVQFQLPGTREVIYAEGEVVRDANRGGRAPGSGIRFTLITEYHRRLIERYIARHQACA